MEIPTTTFLITVRIAVTDDDSRFTSFMISAEGESKPDPRNPRKTITLFPGELRPYNYAIAKFSERCLYSVEQAMNSYKTSIDVSIYLAFPTRLLLNKSKKKSPAPSGGNL